jgi:hypothetical protein
MTVAYMVTVHVTHQDGVDLAEPWILRARHRATGVIEKPRAVGVLENHRTVEFTELAVVASQRSDFHVRRYSRLCGHDQNAGNGKTPTEWFH